MPTRFDLTGEMGKYYENALHVFLSQAIMEPSAADKPRWMSTHTGSVIGQFAGFNWAAGRNVLARYGRLGAKALDPRADWSTLDRARALSVPLYGIAGAYLMGSLVRMLRDMIFPDEKENRKNITAKQQQLQIVAQAGLMGPFEGIVTPFMQFTPSRPMGVGVSAIQSMIFAPINATANYFHNDTDSTNTHERKMARSYLDLMNPIWSAGSVVLPAWASTAGVFAPELVKKEMIDHMAGTGIAEGDQGQQSQRKGMEKKEVAAVAPDRSIRRHRRSDVRLSTPLAARD